MTLVANPAEPGLWTDDDLPAKAKGAHLVLIGVSDYPHLYQGSDPAADHGGMGQLEVSARTALRLFDWLRGRGEFSGAPIVSLRLLLSPRGPELAEAGALAENHYRPATYADIDASIKGWSRQVFGAEGEGDNVAMLFFSGHGLESLGEKVLLASDILNPSDPDGRSNGVTVYPLVKAMKGWGVTRAMLFLDACRNDSPATRALEIEGRDPVRPLANPKPAPAALPCLLATAAGFFAYQKADEPGTYFGQSLIESLEGTPPDFEPYDRTTDPWELPFDRLEERVRNRVRELVAGQSASATQTVEADGHPYGPKMLVARRPPAKPRMSRSAPPGDLSLKGALGGVLGRVGPTSGFEKAAFDLSSVDLGSIDKLAESIFSDFSGELLPAEGLGDPNAMHAAFGHESIAHPWVDGLRLIDVETGEHLPLTTLVLRHASMKEAKTEVVSWIDLLVPPATGKAYWLQQGDGDAARAVVLPSEENFDTPVRLEAIHRLGSEGWALTALEARVGLAEADGNDPWRVMWEAQKAEQVSSLSVARETVRRRAELVLVVKNKVRSPMAAALATAYVLRSGESAVLHDWPRNLANWFDWLPDGAYLWAETLRLRNEEPDAEALEYFLKGAERGVPRLAAVLAMALRQAGWLTEFAVEGDHAEAFATAVEGLRAAARHSAPGGAYLAFAGPDISPLLVASPLAVMA